MIGLDHVADTVEELDNDMCVHMHLNSQGYNDGIILGGPGKYDIDHGARINGMNIAIAGLIQQAGYKRWKGHDMQARAYDNAEQGIDRVVRSVLSWEACEQAAKRSRYRRPDEGADPAGNRQSRRHDAGRRRQRPEYFDEMYKG
jgi:xylose isomerase